ncbi:flagellar motor switch phosphatase FliY [Priestia megaterium]|uniref:Flagellar motor switch phosphatase FliY n=1 Tax=Priestia aryabhattai TaxID=412384 RepID=A0ABD5KYB9_PRIAR|nr:MULTISPECIES: flagellar motor switch phosphatase FliY [Priestia]MDC7765996.1 flagellar motor switch phosphatase FliY [Priestia aryabhattai]MEB4885311.1 flagellar motor switch phosphatase FliY [Priestia megaterium]MED3818490.1 flagellar motor switch phosphatase FliY [Priestia aryabhattai]MED4042147.1 flagellar motor switch phosphatase FliY [Priestia aryabhattai]MED5121571.1 flagellar motor switch phosphatase FliY [Priestia megaterium]
MNDDMLSQDEIDALLKGTSSLDQFSEPNKSSQVDDYFTEMEKDALGEIGNISFGSSATALSALLNQKVDITTPFVSLVYKEELTDEFPNPHVAVQVQYTEGFSGTNLLVIKHEDAAVISDLMLGGTGENPTEIMDEIKLSAVQEAMNQMMGSAATSMSTVFQKKIDISPPSLDILNIQKGEGTELIPQDDVFVKVSFNLKVGTLIDSNIMQLLSISFAKSLVEELLVPSAEGTAASIEKESDLNEKQTEPPTAEYIQHEETQQAEPVHVPVDVQPASFSEFEHVSSPQGDSRNLDMLLDIPLQVTVELGRTKRTVQEILALSSGAIIELDKLAGEPVDILINSKLIAKGEVVVIDENFGVRVTDIISQRDRINKLK